MVRDKLAERGLDARPVTSGSKGLHLYAALPRTLDSDGNIQANEYLRLTLPLGWALGGGGDWNTAWNWCANIPNAAGANAMFLNVIATPSAVPLARDPVCGTFVVPAKALTGGTGADIRYFCSEKCRRAYEMRAAG